MQLIFMRFESKPIEFVLTVDEYTPVDMFGDELRIKQILNNLLSNAFKYTDRGKIELSVSAEIINETPGAKPESQADCTLILRISDTGQGMTEEQINKLFDEYTRFNIDTNRTTIGAGLGMNITKRLIDLMSGEIFVESQPDKGSVFTVRLPQKYIGTDLCGRDLADKLRARRYQSLTKSKKLQLTHEYMPYGSVLIVDDVESNLYVAKGMMLPYGLKVETATSGIEAVEKVRCGEVYDIIFMDYMMPGMDGLEATRIIRDMGYRHPIVALTANVIKGREGIFTDNGFEGYIFKPIDIRELNILLYRHIRNKQPLEVIEAARKERLALASGEADKQAKQSVFDSEFVLTVVRDTEHAIKVLEDILSKINNSESADLELFTTTVHGLKAPFIELGEITLSEAAIKLEGVGIGKNTDEISEETPAFIEALKSFVEKNAPEESVSDVVITHDDTVFLAEKLGEIIAACDMLEIKSAKGAISSLKDKGWPHELKESINELSSDLLRGDYEKVVSGAKRIGKMLG